MSLRLFRSVNWLGGFIALAVATILPIYREVTAESTKAVVAETVDRIVRGEKLYYQATRRQFLYFTAGQRDVMVRELRLPPLGGAADFGFEAFSTGKAQLVVRAITTDAAVKSGRLPPLMYSFSLEQGEELPEDNKAITGQWAELPSRSGSFLNIFGL